MKNRFILLLALLSTACLPSHAEKPRLAIIIDDIGYHLDNGYRTAKLPVPITLAVIPHSPNARELADAGHQAGKEIMLHLPMASHNENAPLEQGGLTTGMAEEEFKSAVRLGLAAVPHIRGVNNHMGSALTEKAQAMQWLMDELRETPYFFIDSRTSPLSQAKQLAEQNNIPSASRDVFLDNSRDHQDILAQLEKAIKHAKRTGYAIVIGHPYPETLEVLERLTPPLRIAGIEFVHISTLLSGTGAQKYSNQVASQP
ncbi:divergent polysaccharide deacetylase family protein [uncultured Pseudoteredinibacter sp.]|uniref:divergent polysaccharide deacetylase family protein n=1 Tax=uncultured Pseudoteredinibacter sp. TaxID=1641701 RepID=UPI00261634B0|nr:divergent polysaccharide deacetylase family protein [uncultured Pseudoteredinibacter sp.]